VAIHDGQDDVFRALADEMCAATANEVGVLNYEWSLSEDGKTCHVLERFADSDGVRAHNENVAAYVERMVTIADIVSVEVYGSPDDGARKMLEGFGARFHRPYAGFVR
jgi:quinol monooxygenase YgiN